MRGLMTVSSNPHPVRRLGAIIDTELSLKVSWLFQSSPSPKTGRYPGSYRVSISELRVPILTQSEDWALCQILQTQPNNYGFQSSPSPKTGRYYKFSFQFSRWYGVPILTQSEDWALYGGEASQNLQNILFQSSPSPKTGRYVLVVRPLS